MALDSDDISRLYEAHAGDLLRFFARRTLQPEVAVDLMAETFAQAFIDRARFRGSEDGWSGSSGLLATSLASTFGAGSSSVAP